MGLRYAELGRIAEQLSPNYMRKLPTEDGWGHTVLFWSDGTNYVLVSPGKDGEFERDWSGADSGGGPTVAFAADIVFGNGNFLSWPEGNQE